MRSCALITTTANALVAPVHDLMPVILRPGAEKRWLDPTLPLAERDALLQPYPADLMRAYAVSRLASNARNDIPEVILPAQAAPNSA